MTGYDLAVIGTGSFVVLGMVLFARWASDRFDESKRRQHPAE